MCLDEEYTFELANSHSELQKYADKLLVGLQNSLFDCGQAQVLFLDVEQFNSAVDAAAETVEFHNIDTDKLNNQKVFAHLAFWVARLKPVRDIRFLDIITIYEKLADYMNVRVENGIHAELIREATEATDEGVSDEKAVQVNAIFAYGLYSLLSVSTNPKFPDENEAFKEMMAFDKMNQVVTSMEFHFHSPRAFATMLNLIG